jgi:hypothetical protein
MRLAGFQRPLIGGGLVILLLTVMPVPGLNSQEPRVQDQTAPPLLKVIPRLEQSQLEETKDSKARVRTSLTLAEAHLANAEGYTTQHDYEGAAAEAGKYWAVVEDALGFLKTLKRDSNKTRDLYKRLELALRSHGLRLASLRRITPSEYAIWIKETEDFARKGRTEALNSFYGQTVVRDGQQNPADQKPGAKPVPKSSITPE